MCSLWVIIIKYGSCGVSFHGMFYSIYSHCLCFHVCDMFPYMFYFIDRFLFSSCIPTMYAFMPYVFVLYLIMVYASLYFILC